MTENTKLYDYEIFVNSMKKEFITICEYYLPEVMQPKMA